MTRPLFASEMQISLCRQVDPDQSDARNPLNLNLKKKKKTFEV